MKPDEIVVGGYYVMQETGTIRHFYGLSPSGKVRYRSYDPKDGEYLMTSHCAVEDLVYRIERKAIREEISRLKEWKAETEYRTSSLGKVLRQTKDRR